MELTDFNIYYKGKQLKNILRTSWVDMPNGFEGDDYKYIVLIKIVYVDDNGKVECIEKPSDNFVLLPKVVDIFVDEE